MLRRKAFNRIFITTLVFFITLVLYSVHKTDDVFQNKNKVVNNSYIYSLNQDNYVSKASIYVSKDLSIEDKVKQKLETMIKENNKNILLPSYLKPVLPENTKVEKVLFSDGIIKVYFSEELLNISEEQSEKMIEAIIYTVTDDDILGVEIYVNNSMLKYVPKTNKKIKGVLSRDFGINKIYEVSSSSDIVKVVMNYYGRDGEKYYDIPVTKYVNSNTEKLEVIVDEYNKISNNNLISFIDNINLINYEIEDQVLKINLGENIDYNGIDNFFKTVFDNYDINKVVIFCNNQKKVEKNRKDIEKS